MCTTVPGVGDGILKPALNVGSSPSLATSSLGSLHPFPHLHMEMVLATSQGHCQDGQAVCSYGVKAGTSASFNE